MAIQSFPQSSGGLTSVVRSIQRGTAASAGNITITSVDTTKTTVNSFSTSSSGTIAASGTLSGPTGTGSATSGSGTLAIREWNASYLNTGGSLGVNMNQNAQNISLNATNLSGGSTNLIAGVNGAYLSSSTNLVVTGPCRYEVVEYY